MGRVGRTKNGPLRVPKPEHCPPVYPGATLAKAARDAATHAAQTITYVAATSWWRTLVERACGNPDSLPPAAFALTDLDLSDETKEEAAALGHVLAALPVREGCTELGRIYTHALPSEKRASQGIFYTPPPLVSRLLDTAERAGHDWLMGSAIDPSCGGGAFLIEAAGRILSAMPTADPAIIVAAASARLRGWDIDPFACWLTQLVVEAQLLPQVIASGKRLGQITACKDSLKAYEGAEGQFNLVMGNPAFGRVKKTPELGRRFARSLYGHPNLYGMLTDVAVRLARPDGGVVAYLTPTGYLGGEYFKMLRKLLAAQAPPVSIDIVESRADVFADVLQEVSLTCFKRGERTPDAICSVIHVEVDDLKVTETGRLMLPADPTEPWIVPRQPHDGPLVAKLAQMPTRLRDWGYKVSTGPLVWNRHKDRLHANSGEGRYPVIWAEAVTPDGRFSFQASKANHRERGWFSPEKAGDPNLVATRCVLAQRTTSKEQDRRLVCAVLPKTFIDRHGAIAVENHLNMFVPAVMKPKVPLNLLAAFLSTKGADRVIRCINGSVALSASELEAMPLPSVDDLRTALSGRDPESAILRLYGIGNDTAANTACQRNP